MPAPEMSPLVIPWATGRGPDALPARWYRSRVTTSAEPRAVVVLAPGAGAGQDSAWMTHVASGLAAQGLAVLTFDFPYRAAGRRLPDRAPTLLRAFAAAVAAVPGVVAPARPPVFVGGKSMGGRMATMLAAEPEHWPPGVSIAGALAFGYPLMPPTARRQSAGDTAPPARPPADRAAHFSRLAVPLLVVQGTRDPFGGPDAVRHAAAGAARLEVVAVDGGDHDLAVPRRGHPPQHEVDQGIWHTVSAWIARCP